MKVVECIGRRTAKKYFKVIVSDKDFIITEKSVLGFIIKTSPYIKILGELILGFVMLISFVFGLWAIYTGLQAFMY